MGLFESSHDTLRRYTNNSRITEVNYANHATTC